jgi:hypothetical protein
MPVDRVAKLSVKGKDPQLPPGGRAAAKPYVTDDALRTMADRIAGVVYARQVVDLNAERRRRR